MSYSPLPKRRLRKPKTDRQRNRAHCQWVRGHECAAAHVDSANCRGKIEAAHVREGGNHGMGRKPDDSFVIPLCSHHHHIQHNKGAKTFERTYGVNCLEVAGLLWRKSPYNK